MERCKRCGEPSVILDPFSSLRVCSSCGAEQSADNFQFQAFTSDGLALTSLVRSVGNFSHRDRVIYHADIQISDVTSHLGLSAARADDVRALVSQVTDGAFGGGSWFPVLIAACACVVMRRNRLPLSVAEAASTIGTDAREVGRMISRVVAFLGIEQLPEFNIFQSLERVMKTCPDLSGIEEERTDEMVRQGRFLLECAVKWFLTTGRQPLPLVAAVASFIAEVNRVEVDVEVIAKEIYAVVSTSKLRKRELLETLVKVAKALLPWGNDVTVKNVVHNAPMLLRCMEIKSKAGTFNVDEFGFGLQDRFGGYLSLERNDARYFNKRSRDDTLIDCEDIERAEVSAECLANAYKAVMERSRGIEPFGGFEKDLVMKMPTEDIHLLQPLTKCIRGSNEMLSLEDILDKDVGYDTPPPSFIAGLEARERRRKKIDSAKDRIRKVMRPSSVDSSENKTVPSPERVRNKKRRRRDVDPSGIDWEDCIIELLLLQQVDEEEIEQGHYNRLLDLHVFSCVDIQKKK